MRQEASYHIADMETFKGQLGRWAAQFEYVAVLRGDSDASQGKHLQYDMLVGVGALTLLPSSEDSLAALANYQEEKKDWLFGYLSYDLKNELEDLSSANDDHLCFPTTHFFQPEWVFVVKGSEVHIYFPAEKQRSEMHQVFGQIMRYQEKSFASLVPSIQPRISQEEYLSAVRALQEHIQRGDIYEVNFCQEFYAEGAVLHPSAIFQKLYQISRPPFAAYYRLGKQHLMCASPERYLKKIGDKLISQPIKGTAKRGASRAEDEQLKEALFNCPKERSENVMIVDLVRNDLSRTAAMNSVEVEELFGVYTFPQVHQLISTITSELKEGVHWSEAIRHSFPMGSMTGAPKIRAMQLIEQYESSKRGLYSGAVGYITPEGDFDFNVVIRSILYNADKQYASFMVGGAITAQALAEKEYEECMIKAKAMFQVLGHDC
jgi:para-aminobenzoate synthetase component 1